MTNLRKVLGFLTAVAFVAFALPASAARDPAKNYSMVVSAPTSTVKVTIRNETPQSGNSTINSFIIYPPTSGVTITLPATGRSDTTPATVSQPVSGGPIYVNGFDGLKSGNQTPKQLVINVLASYTPAPGCGSSYGWTASVYTGNSFGVEEFSKVDPVTKLPMTSPTFQSVTCYSLIGLPTSLAAGTSTPKTVTATLKNENPTGGPSITSFTLTAPSDVTMTSPSPNSWNPNLGPQDSTNITVSVSAACGAAGGGWGSTASGSSGVMTLTAPLPSMSIVDCYVKFTPPPPNAIASGEKVADPIVGVTAYDGSDAVLTSWNGSVTWSLTPTGGGSSVSGGNPQGGLGVYTYPDLTITGTVGSSFSLKASTQVGTALAGTSVTSDPFTIFSGVLYCDDPMADTLMNDPGSGGVFGNPGTGKGKRWYNKDGSDCILVGYTFTNTILTNNTVKLVWDTLTQPNAVFDYTVFWRPQFVNPNTGLPKSRVKVAWEVDGFGNPKYVWGNACLSKNPPTVYTTLNGTITDATSVNVNAPSTTTPLAVPFAVVIGTERMTVTSVGTGTNWTVVRGAGVTTPVTHLSGAKVMTTPLPIDANPLMPDGTTTNPYYKKQVHMCIWEDAFQSWAPAYKTTTVSAADLYDCATQPTLPLTLNDIKPVACILRKTSVFDIGDGFMSVE